MVGVAQLVEPRVVISAVVGSSPIVHPIFRMLGLVALAGRRPRSAAGPRTDSAAVRGWRFDRLGVQAEPEEPAGLGRGPAAVVRRVEASRRRRRARRTQQPHVHHRRPLGPHARRNCGPATSSIIQFGHNDSGALESGTAGLDAPAARARHDPRDRRRIRRDRQRDHGQTRNRLLVRLVPAKDDRGRARERRDADPLHAHQDQ